MAYANASKFTRGYSKITHPITPPLVEFKVNSFALHSIIRIVYPWSCPMIMSNKISADVVKAFSDLMQVDRWKSSMSTNKKWWKSFVKMKLLLKLLKKQKSNIMKFQLNSSNWPLEDGSSIVPAIGRNPVNHWTNQKSRCSSSFANGLRWRTVLKF